MQRRQCPNFEIRFACSSSTSWLILLILVDKWGFLPLRSSEITSSPHVLFSSSEQKDNAKNNLSGSAWKGHIPHSPISFRTKLGDPETLSFAVFIDKEASFPHAAPPVHLHSWSSFTAAERGQLLTSFPSQRLQPPHHPTGILTIPASTVAFSHIYLLSVRPQNPSPSFGTCSLLPLSSLSNPQECHFSLFGLFRLWHFKENDAICICFNWRLKLKGMFETIY